MKKIGLNWYIKGKNFNKLTGGSDVLLHRTKLLDKPREKRK